MCARGGGGTGDMVVVMGERRLLDMLSLPSRVSVQQLRAYADEDLAGEPDAYEEQDPHGFGNCGKPA